MLSRNRLQFQNDIYLLTQGPQVLLLFYSNVRQEGIKLIEVNEGVISTCEYNKKPIYFNI